MTLLAPAVGNRSFVGFRFEEQSANFAVGRPRSDEIAVTDPSVALTAAASGGAGNITEAASSYAYSYLKDGTFETKMSPASVSLALSAKNCDLSVIAASGSALVTARKLWRSFSPLSAPSSAPSGALAGAGVGNVTDGTHTYKVTFITSNGETLPSSASGIVTVVDGTGTDGKVTVTIPVADSSEVTGRKIYRTVSGNTGDYLLVGTVSNNTATTYLDNVADGSLGAAAPTTNNAFELWEWFGTLWNNTSTTYTDSLASDSTLIERTYSPKRVNQTNGNWGHRFQLVEPGTDIKRDDKDIPSTELTGAVMQAKSMPGPAEFKHDIKQLFRPGWAVPAFGTFLGKPTITRIANEPVSTYAFSPSDLLADSLSAWLLMYEGGGLRPVNYFGNKCGEIVISWGGAKGVSIDTKWVGTGNSEMGVGVPQGTYTYKYAPIVKGVRSDTDRTTDAIYIKITTAPSGGTFAFKAKVGSAASYGGAASVMTGYYSSGAQVIGGQQFSDWIELIDEDGNPIGQYLGENRSPVLVIFPYTMTTLEVNDEFIVPALSKIPAPGTTPGTDDGTYTGFERHIERIQRLTDAHVRVKTGTGSTPEDLFFGQSGTLKLSRPIDDVYFFGDEARAPVTVDNYGTVMADLTLARRLDSYAYERMLKENLRLSFEIYLRGGPICINPGSYSTHREELKITLPQMRISDAKSALASMKVLPETLTFKSEQPDDEALAGITTVIKSREYWIAPLA